MNTWFISDIHFSHKNIIRFCDRPFSSVEEMNETIITNWNNTVSQDDIVYNLGDFSFGHITNTEHILRRLQCKEHHLLLGNHDKAIINKKKFLLENKYFTSIQEYKELTINKQFIVLCHYAFSVFNKSHHDSWNLYGHSHSTHEDYRVQPLQMDVGIDNAYKLLGEYRPFSFEEIERILNKRKKSIGNLSVDHHGTPNL